MMTNRSSLPGPDDITRVVLPNGITVLVRSNFNSPAVAITGYIQAGSLFDPDDKLGLAYFTASALMRGTKNRDFQELYDSLESIGASLGFSGSTHTTGFSGKALAEDIDQLLLILSDTLREPVFPAKYIDLLKAQHLTSLAIRAQSTNDMAALKFDEIVYKGHPYARPDDGYPETVQRITRQDLIDFHRQHYGSRGMVLVIVGAVEPDVVIEKVSRVLGDWENPNQGEPMELPPVQSLTGIVKEKVVIPGKIQSDIVLGVAGPSRLSEDFLAASLGNSILGQFGMMGRIGESVREKAGLAYYAYSTLSGGIGPGPWVVHAGVNPANVDKAIALIIREIERFISEYVRQEELDDSRESVIGMMPLALESNFGVASALLNLERYQLGLDYYQKFEGMLREITVEQVFETARKYLNPEKIAIAIAGP